MAGGKRSGARFSEEDVELLRSVVEEGFMTLDRLRFQEGLVQEQSQRERAEELTRLKSEFVSHVSHELRAPTPLSPAAVVVVCVLHQPGLALVETPV